MGPFNGHLIRDVGAFFCAIAAVSLFAVMRPTEAKIKLACLTTLVFAVPHLVYHSFMIHMFPTPVDKILGISTLR